MLAKPKKPRPVREVPESVRDAIAAGVRKNKLSKSQTARFSQKRAIPTLVGAFKFWQTAWKETYPGVPFPVWRKGTEHKALESYMRRAALAGAEPFYRYLDWCIRMWPYMMETEFGWMTNKPPYPEPLFLVRHAPAFEQAYLKQHEIAERLRLTTRERMVKELIDKGFPHDIAEREVDEKLGIAEQRVALEKEKEELLKQRLAFDRQKNYRALRETLAMQKKASKFMQDNIPLSEIEVNKGFGAYEQPTDG